MAPGMVFETVIIFICFCLVRQKKWNQCFLNYGGPALSSKTCRSNEKIVSRVLRFFGIGEAALETEIVDIIEAQTNPTIAPLAGDGEVTLG